VRPINERLGSRLDLADTAREIPHLLDDEGELAALGRRRSDRKGILVQREWTVPDVEPDELSSLERDDVAPRWRNDEFPCSVGNPAHRAHRVGVLSLPDRLDEIDPREGEHRHGEHRDPEPGKKRIRAVAACLKRMNRSEHGDDDSADSVGSSPCLVAAATLLPEDSHCDHDYQRQPRDQTCQHAGRAEIDACLPRRIPWHRIVGCPGNVEERMDQDRDRERPGYQLVDAHRRVDAWIRTGSARRAETPS